MSQAESSAADRELPRGVLVLGGLAAAFIVVAGLRAASGLVGPVFLALVLTIAVHPVRRWLTRARVPGWPASLVCVLAVYALMIGLSLSLVTFAEGTRPYSLSRSCSARSWP